MNRRCMLIILLLCVLKTTSGQKDESTVEDDYTYDDEFTSESVEISPSDPSLLATMSEGSSSEQTVDKSSDTSIISTTPTVPITVPTTPITTTTTTTTIKTILEAGKSIETTTESNRQKCPQKCHCFEDQVECSHQNLLQIPKYLPINTASLNLSHNSLATLNVSELINYSQLRQLILNDNQIETIIDTEAFQKLSNLHHIDLTRNALKPLQGREFSRAKALATLILAGNENVVPPNVAFLQTYKLKTLNLSNCSISNLSDNIFQNLSSLLALYLDENPMNVDMNVNAFKYLVNLRTLYIPTIDRTIAEKLCQQLESLDIVRLTLEPHDLSCFLLTSGSTFDESTVRIGQATVSILDNESDDLYKVPTNPPPSLPQSTELTTTEKINGADAPQKGSKNIGPKVSSQKMSSQSVPSQSETRIEDIQTKDNPQPLDNVEEAKVDVSIEMIYLILIVVIAVTLVCLTIALICRLDCCGIKTKCCRRAHNRAETEDRVRPHEEIPLNKV